jgi:predicted Fe-Mo cluster-binding NifX family protein
MKIALPSKGDMIDSHFGHCEYFTVFTVKDSEIIGQEIVPSPVGCGCKSNIASLLAEKGVTMMLAGNMGDGAVNVLTHSGIEVIRGCQGNITEVALSCLSGNLMDSGDSCHAHEHECQHE